jgi:integrase
VRIKEWLAEAEHARFYGESRHSWKEAFLKYSEEVLPGAVKPGAADRYLCSLRQLDPYLSDKFIDQIDAKLIATIVSARKRLANRQPKPVEGKPAPKALGASNSTVRRDLTALGSVLKACVAWGWRTDNPAKNYDRSMIREVRDAVQPVAWDEIEKLLSGKPGGFKGITELLRFTGMRQQEAVSLEWRQVDLQRAEITLYKTKTSRPRVVPLSAQSVGTISAQKRILACPYVFTHGDGLRYANFATNFTKAIKRAKLDFRCHDLRHTMAIGYLNAGGDIYRLSKILGHTSVKTTEMYLGYVGDGSARKSAQDLRLDIGELSDKALVTRDKMTGNAGLAQG